MSSNPNSYRLTKNMKEKIQDNHFLQKELGEGKTPQEILGYTDEAMADLYQTAYLFFEKEAFKEAAASFLFLATLNPNNYDFWLGLGMSLQRTQEYEKAIDAYELASIANISSPIPYFYLAKCLFAIHDRESALQAIDLAIEMAEEEEEYEELKIQAEAARNSMIKFL